MERQTANVPQPDRQPAKPAAPLHAHPLTQILRALGTRAGGRFIQAKLTVSQPGDQYEQEADRVADQVMRMPDPATPATVRSDGPPQISGLQRKCAQYGEEQIQRQPMDEEMEEEEDLPLQAKGDAGPTPQVTPARQSQIDGLRGGGQPLPWSVRAFFEPRFGRDFSQVRIHTDARADESARAVNAKAFTLGPNVVFGAGEYLPQTNEGRRLLAHELTHVIQQNQGGGPPGPSHEAEADGVASQVSSGQRINVQSGVNSGSVQRFEIVEFGDVEKQELLDFWRGKLKRARKQENRDRYQKFIDIIEKGERPSWVQSEKDIQYFYEQIGGRGKGVYKSGRKGGWVKSSKGFWLPESGSSVPDITLSSANLEIKNYSITNLDDLVYRLKKQISARELNVAYDLKQQGIILDFRGQDIDESSIQALVERIEAKVGVPSSNIQVVRWKKPSSANKAVPPGAKGAPTEPAKMQALTSPEAPKPEPAKAQALIGSETPKVEPANPLPSATTGLEAPRPEPPKLPPVAPEPAGSKPTARALTPTESASPRTGGALANLESAARSSANFEITPLSPTETFARTGTPDMKPVAEPVGSSSASMEGGMAAIGTMANDMGISAMENQEKEKAANAVAHLQPEIEKASAEGKWVLVVTVFDYRGDLFEGVWREPSTVRRFHRAYLLIGDTFAEATLGTKEQREAAHPQYPLSPTPERKDRLYDHVKWKIIGPAPGTEKNAPNLTKVAPERAISGLWKLVGDPMEQTLKIYASGDRARVEAWSRTGQLPVIAVHWDPREASISVTFESQSAKGALRESDFTILGPGLMLEDYILRGAGGGQEDILDIGQRLWAN